MLLNLCSNHQCIYHFQNVFSQIKTQFTQTWYFKIYSLWCWNMGWAFTISSETVKQPVLFYAFVGFSRARGPHTLTGRGQSPFHPLCSRCFVSAWVLDLRKSTTWSTVEKVPFLWSTIYPANCGKKKIGHLELVPSSITASVPFSVTFYKTISYWILGSLGSTNYKILVPHSQLAIKWST